MHLHHRIIQLRCYQERKVKLGQEIPGILCPITFAMTDSIHSAGIWKKEDDDKFFFYLHVFRQKQAPPQDHLSVIVSSVINLQ